MANEPKNRHSKSKRPAVTIDLDPSDVQKVQDENETEAAGEGATTAAEEQVTQEGVASEASEQLSGTAGEGAPAEDGEEDAEAAADGAPDAGEPADGSPEPEQEVPAVEAGPKPAAERPKRSAFPAALGGGVIGAVIAVAGAAALQWNGMLPVPQGDIAALRQEVADLKNNPPAPAGIDKDTRAAIVSAQEAANSALSRADAASAAADQIKDDLATTQKALKAIEAKAPPVDSADLKTLQDKVATIEQTVAGLAKGTRAGADLKSAVTRLSGRVDALGGKLDAAASKADKTAPAVADNAKAISSLKSDVAAIKQVIARSADQPKIARAIAATALKSAIDRGGSFVTELQTYASVAPKSPQLDALRQYAAKGVPTINELQDRFSGVADKIIAATKPADKNAGFFGELVDSAKSLVKVRPVGNVEGNGPDAIVAQIGAALNVGDVGRALKEWDSLPDAGKSVSKDFADNLRARRDADRLVSGALAEAINPGNDAGTSK